MNNTVIKNSKVYTLTADKHEKVSFLMQAGKDIVRKLTFSCLSAVRV